MFHKCCESVSKVLYICCMGTEHWKKDMICPVCGKAFKGTAKAMMCGSTCRSRLKRILEAGRKPEFYLMAKSKGQKVPLLFARPSPKKEKEEVEMPKIKYAENHPESYDAERISFLLSDEAGQMPPPPTKEEIQQIIADLESEKKIIANRVVLIGSPKANALQKSIEIDAIQEKIEQWQKLLT